MICQPPRRSHARALWTAVVATAVVSLFGPAVAGAQSTPEMKAAFLYNFAKFIEWPADALPSTGPLRICVSDADISAALVQIVGGQSIDQHPVVVSRLKRGEKAPDCHVLYLGVRDMEWAGAMIPALQGAPVFSVSDADDFIAAGGITQFLLRDGRLRFAINSEAAQRARLRISSRLLHLATPVKDGRHGGLL
jgi:hypothetical protein